MTSEKMTAKFVGVMFITASAAPILTALPLGFLIDKGPDYLTKVSENEIQVMIGFLLELIWTLAVFGVPVMLYPILKKQNETGSVGFLGLRFIEAVTTVIGSSLLLALITISHEFVNTGGAEASYYQILGDFILTIRDWMYMLGPGIIFALSAVVLNYILYQSQLVPRWLSGWGLIGGSVMFAVYLLQLAIDLLQLAVNLEFLFLLIAVQEMAFAVWLIVKGFNSTALASLNVKTDTERGVV
ncbi:MAG: DUF4386 domain-containing protein [Candidatus Hodarchaeales archaeon]|jgi:hypothetical protein